jgi:hypothetical protein
MIGGNNSVQIPDEAVILEVGTGGFHLQEYFENYEKVITLMLPWIVILPELSNV